MPQCLVATVAPCGFSRPAFHSARTQGKRLSAPGSKEFAIHQSLHTKASRQPQRSTPPKQNKLDEFAPYSRALPRAGRQNELVCDSDGELYVLCPQCHLPLGDLAYTADDDEGRLVHAECKAQLLIRDARREEEFRLKRDATLKKQRREQYGLGWKVARAPRNWGPAGKLGCGIVPHGLCGLVWHEKSKTVRVIPAVEQPAAAVNLEYLSLALQVRMKEGREPMFSLDPKDICPNEPQDKHNLWQVKRFEPQWLEGTSVGEVMFQADYHLKELSMGEYYQPVIGMKSAFDFSEEEGIVQEWSAREWFIVNKAGIQLTEEDVMIPVVHMGVEARETCKGTQGLEDVPLTRPDHPLVKYAQEFTHYFDLIAERKSVVYHLRELAKATVLAKFLMENNACLDSAWFGLAEVPVEPPSGREIPQLWNEHRATQIQVVDGQIMSSEGGTQSHTRGVYGGVELGVERLGRVGAARVPPTKVMAARVPTLTARMISARGTVPEFAVGAPGVPKGIDLNLDKFELSAAPASIENLSSSWTGKGFVGGAFWESLSGGALAEDDRKLLMEVFHPGLSDRRNDGDMFVPPSSSLAYVSHLRSLVMEEVAVRKARKECFLSEDFAMASPGPLFPSSWTSSLGIAHGQKLTGAPVGLHPRPDYKADACRLLKSSVPVFDNCTEDGTRFRTYQIGRIEVRTTQVLGNREEVGAVFSSRALARDSIDDQVSTVAKVDKVVKVTEYAEKAENQARRFYVVVETDQGDMIRTEKRMDQKVMWVENPSDLEYRNSLAKVVRAADCRSANVSAHELKNRISNNISTTASCGSCKRYAHDAFLAVLPARQKAWAALAALELSAAQELGCTCEAAWDEGSAEVWGLPWSALGDLRREAASALGYDQDTWGSAGRKAAAEKKQGEPADVTSAKPAEQRDWAELSQAEQEERVTQWFEKHYGSSAGLLA
eukprot:CAMPEP_0179055412 /NCGR_PEP_ID=MMETSP0796-20121207/23288_1 /TAXON_ID=73915 /ORGANISM="Pyrodinium bahamense, Strain pbaha01" /LENGTH=945 /DNA_ID=CAMNT_0020752065 /DNA_START=20 /DNA_END=2857 /DNA_ORIENTATION=-